MRWSAQSSARSSPRTATPISEISCCRPRWSIFPPMSACAARTTRPSANSCKPGPSGTTSWATPTPACGSISTAPAPRSSRTTSASEAAAGCRLPAALRDAPHALSLGSGDGPRRYRSLAARHRPHSHLFSGDRHRRHRHRRLLRPGAAGAEALADLAARSLCRDFPVYAAADTDRVVLLCSANPAKFLSAGLAGGGAGADIVHGRVLHRDLSCRRDVDRPRPVAGGARARDDLSPVDAADRAAAGGAPDDAADCQPIDHPVEEHRAALCRGSTGPDVYELDCHCRDLPSLGGLHERSGNVFHHAVPADAVRKKAGGAG